MNPGGQRGSKNMVNLMRIGQWTVGSQITEDGKYVLLYIIEGCDPVNRLFYCNLAALPPYSLPGSFLLSISIQDLVFLLGRGITAWRR